MTSSFHMVLQAAAALLLLTAMAGSGFCLFAARVVPRHRGGPTGGARALSATLLKPLHGEEPDLRRSLLGYLAQDYGAPVEMRLGVQSPDDRALPVARSLEGGGGRPVTVVVDATEHGANRKVSNLVNLERIAPLAEMVVQSDSDIAVDADYLVRLSEALADPAVGVASCLYFGEAARPVLASRLGAMGVSYQTLPMFAAGVALGATPCMGSTIALRRETLERIGGFASVKDVLADDYALGARVRTLGLKSVVPPMLVAHRSSESSLGELWRHELRWSKTVGDIDRWGHLGSVVTHPLPLALLGWAATGFAWPGSAVVALSLGCRLWLKGRVDATVGASTGPWWLLPVRDMLSLAVFVAAGFAARVDWRGSRFHVGRDGGLTPV